MANPVKTTNVSPPPPPLPRPNINPQAQHPAPSAPPVRDISVNTVMKRTAGILAGAFLAAALGGSVYLSKFDIKKMNVRTPPKPTPVRTSNSGELAYIHNKAAQFAALDSSPDAREKLKDGLIEEQTVKAVLSIKQLNPNANDATIKADGAKIHESYAAMFTKIDANYKLLLESDQQATKDGRLAERKKVETEVLTSFDEVHKIVAPSNGQGVINFQGPTPKKFSDNFRR